mmetsp:Transcript_12658/g.19063  ORF Transcript_12658/g.19063 Transcript_12658/m.19063 type:complete len:193 (+) Transcript_12658:108-686(+)
MIRALHPRSNGVIANAATILCRSALSPDQQLPSRALSIAPISSSSIIQGITLKQPTEMARSFSGTDRLSRQWFHASIMHSKSMSTSVNDVYVTMESGSSSSPNNNNLKTEQSTTTTNREEDSSSSSGSACSQGIPDLEMEDDDDDQEEMFVTADPVLGLGTIQEWGGPRRGGSLSEPTRFGDWERKGRCTDF